MIMLLNLYSTSNCHLCESAYALIMKIPDISVTVIEVAVDELLLTKYGLRIPVLQRQDTKIELNWPFTVADIHELLQ